MNKLASQIAIEEINKLVGKNNRLFNFVEKLTEFFMPTEIVLILRAAKEAKIK